MVFPFSCVERRALKARISLLSFFNQAVHARGVLRVLRRAAAPTCVVVIVVGLEAGVASLVASQIRGTAACAHEKWPLVRFEESGTLALVLLFLFVKQHRGRTLFDKQLRKAERQPALVDP